jgi:hypothetical protein
MFQGLSCMFQALICITQALVFMFHGLKHKINRGLWA